MLLDFGSSLTCVVAGAGCSGFFEVVFLAVCGAVCVGVFAAKTCEFLPLGLAERSCSLRV